MPQQEPEPAGSPLEQLGVLASQVAHMEDSLDHLELYTQGGLLTLLWHGPAEAEGVVVCVGGAMGGLLGPAEAMYHLLGREMAERGIGLIRVGYRKANDLDRCVHDTLAALELAARHGARRFVPIGHSFGGAVAIQAAAHLDASTAPGVVTLATQSAGCEAAELLGDRSLLLFHGTRDQILPPEASHMVRFLAGTGELVLVPDADHLFRPGWEAVLARLVDHLPAVLAEPGNPSPSPSDPGSVPGSGSESASGGDQPPPPPPSSPPG